MTGIGLDFYPTYGDHDPYAAKDRGYYFNGNSMMWLPPNDEDSSISLVMSPTHSLSFWIKPTAPGGAIISKEDSNNSY